MMTIDNAYMSDLMVGVIFSRSLENMPSSSGAVQRIVLPPWGVDALTEAGFFVIEDSPKSARKGLPFESMRMLGYG